MKFAIYARFSTDLQDKTSIDGQISNCEILAEREKLRIVATFKDEGISGNDDSRPGYQKLQKALKTGKYDGVLCDETSRITRNHSELLRLVEELRFRDQCLITFDGVDTRSESAQILLGVKGAMDQMEARKIGLRVYRSHKARLEQGHSAGGKIYGYSSIQDGDYKKRVPDPDQASIVMEIFERFAEGESAKKIVRDFNERGIPSPGSYWTNVRRRSIGWTHTTLVGSYSKASGILRNEIYKGVITWNKRASKKVPGTGRRIQVRRPESEWMRVADESVRIVSDELWGRVEARLISTRGKFGRKGNYGRPPRYLFSGILKCDSCGGNYSVRNGRHYACSSQANGRNSLCANKKMIRKSVIEEQLLADIKGQLLEPTFTKEVAKRIRSVSRKTSAPRSKSRSDLTCVERQIEDLAVTICDVGRSDILTSKLKTLELEREQILAELEAPKPTALAAGAEETWKKVVSGLENLHKYAQPDQVETARAALQGIIGEVRIVEEKHHVIAYPQIANNVVYKSGAEKRT